MDFSLDAHQQELVDSARGFAREVLGPRARRQTPGFDREAWEALGDGYRVEVRVVAWKRDDVVRVPTSALFRRGEGWVAASHFDVPVKEGALDDPKVEAVFGLHVGGWVETGQVGFAPGPFFASSDTFTIEVAGRGVHGAQPHQGQLLNRLLPRSLMRIGRVLQQPEGDVFPDLQRIEQRAALKQHPEAGKILGRGRQQPVCDGGPVRGQVMLHR